MAKKYWFVAKRYGWGWTPASKEGWAVLLGYIVLVLYMSTKVDSSSNSESETLIRTAPGFIILTAILIFICYKTGETPSWRWGNKKRSAKGQ